MLHHIRWLPNAMHDGPCALKKVGKNSPNVSRCCSCGIECRSTCKTIIPEQQQKLKSSLSICLQNTLQKMAIRFTSVRVMLKRCNCKTWTKNPCGTTTCSCRKMDLLALPPMVSAKEEVVIMTIPWILMALYFGIKIDSAVLIRSCISWFHRNRYSWMYKFMHFPQMISFWHDVHNSICGHTRLKFPSNVSGQS